MEPKTVSHISLLWPFLVEAGGSGTHPSSALPGGCSWQVPAGILLRRPHLWAENITCLQVPAQWLLLLMCTPLWDRIFHWSFAESIDSKLLGSALLGFVHIYVCIYTQPYLFGQALLSKSCISCKLCQIFLILDVCHLWQQAGVTHKAEPWKITSRIWGPSGSPCCHLCYCSTSWFRSWTRVGLVSSY